MLIYRIEHEEYGIGPLCGKLSNFRWRQTFVDHQGPFEFGRDITCSFDEWTDTYGQCNSYFGMQTLEQLFDLLRDPETGIDYLSENNFVGMIYEIDEEKSFKFPDGQVSFIKSEAKLIQKTNLMDFFYAFL